mmetsp:Transcript_10994/g.17975  ORF Transcript_10994/g.17975 Transcript_10994/m.17975 type:complete len:142 (+) Transcript_10994:32-457(+)
MAEDEQNLPRFTIEDLKAHQKRDDLWLAINGKVYDVTEFLDEHPGGPDVMVDSGGRDATTDFDDVGHSEDARSMLKKYLKGVYVPPLKKAKAVAAPATKSETVISKTASPTTGGGSSLLTKVALPVAIGGIALALYLRLYS